MPPTWFSATASLVAQIRTIEEQEGGELAPHQAPDANQEAAHKKVGSPLGNNSEGTMVKRNVHIEAV